ncbi:MAG: tetratricopeptide repeat protein [Planctomycetota bacterium]
MVDVSEEATAHYLEGMRLFGEDRYTEAIEAYRRALVAQPGWTEAMHGVAMAHMHDGQLDEAIRVGLEICELDAKDPFAHTSLSMFYQRKGAVAEAAGDAQQSAAMIEAAEKEGARARMLSWKEDLKTNPNAVPPGPPGSMDVIQ